MSLGSNSVDRERSLRKILARHRCTNFCINCTSLARFVPSFVQWRNGPKCTRTERNAPKHEFRVQWCGSGAFVAKILTRHHGTNFCINCTSLARFAASFCNSETVQKAPERKETHQTMSLGSNSVDRERSLQKILTRQRGLNFCINCTSLVCFAASFFAIAKRFQCTQTERNKPKHEFRVQWCGSGAFVPKNSNNTSLHELLH